MADEKITQYAVRTNTPMTAGSLFDVSEKVGAGFNTAQVPIEEIEFDYPGWHIVGTGGEPTFEPGIVNVGGGGDPSLSFYKDQTGRVYIRGLVKSTNAPTNNQVLFQLPAAYRPNCTVRVIIYFTLPAGTVSDKIDNGYMTCVIESGGNVLIKDVLITNSIYDLSSVNFRTS